MEKDDYIMKVAKCLMKYTPECAHVPLDSAPDGKLLDCNGMVLDFAKDWEISGGKFSIWHGLRKASAEDWGHNNHTHTNTFQLYHPYAYAHFTGTLTGRLIIESMILS